MDGWWNEEETFFPFDESPEEEAPLAEEELHNPFKPISVADRFQQMGQKPQPAANPFTPPKPGQPYGQAYSRMAPLSPARPFSQIQQGDLYGYSNPDDTPAAVAPTHLYAAQPNPFGNSVGASPLGASTPEDMSGFTGRTSPLKRSEMHQTQQSPSVPIWSIDDDPVAFPPAPAGGAASPYPGFPPLPQSTPAPWQPPTQAAPAAPAEEPAKDGLDWSLPAYPEADPDWQPAEGESSPVPDFLKEMEAETPEETPDEPASPMEKLNIPAYLRVQPLPKKKPRPEPEYTQPDETQAEEPAAAPETTQPAAQPAQVGDWFTDAVFMRPKSEPLATEPDEPSPEEEIVAAVTEQPAQAESAIPVVVAPGSRRSRRSRMAAQQPETPEAAFAPTPAVEAAPAQTTPVDTAPVQVPPVQTAPAFATNAIPADMVAPAQTTPVDTAPMQVPPVQTAPAEAAQDPAPRKRRSRRNEPIQVAPAPEEAPAAQPAPTEERHPFVPAVGAEDSTNESSAARPAQETTVQPDSTPFSPWIQPQSETPSSPFPAPQSGFFLPVSDEEDAAPFGGTGIASAMPFQPSTPYISPALAPTGEIDGEDDWHPFAEPVNPGIPDSPFPTTLPPIPDAQEQEWSPFGSLAGQDALAGSPFVDTFAASTKAQLPNQQAHDIPLPDALFPLFGAENPSPIAESTPSEAFHPLVDTDDLFQDSASNLSADESPLFGTSSYDAGAMPNPTRGHMPYDLVSEFDTQNRLKESTALPDSDSGLFGPEPTHSSAVEPAPEQASASFPPVHQQPAQPLLSKKNAAPKPAKPPINPVRLLLLVLAIAMAVFCIIAGCKMLLGYVQNTEDWSRTHEQFLSQHGVSMNQAGELVQLPQDGSTFAPTSAPAMAATPPPSHADGQHTADAAQQDHQPTATPVLRTKQHQYPDNPLRNLLPAMVDIRKEYPEVIGRLVIPGVVDEWVMQRNNTYYLNHNYRGTSAEGGAVFIDAACTLDTPPENLHLRGSGSVAGKTFHPLWQYKTGGMSFINNAEVAHLTTLYEEAQYLLYAVIETTGDPSNPNYFNYASHPTFATDEEMMDYLALARQHSIYNLPTDVQPGDRLLTLSTVTGTDGSGDQTNLVLIFRSVR